MELIARYSERRLNGKREFELYPDRILFSGKAFMKNEFDVDIDLKDLSPRYDKLKCREISISVGLLFIIVPIIFFIAFALGFGATINEPVMQVMIIFSVVGWVILAVTYKKIEFYNFKNSVGFAVLSIGRSGPGKAGFDEFVGQLVSCIKQCQSGDQPESESENGGQVPQKCEQLGEPDLEVAGLVIWVHGCQPKDEKWLNVTIHCGGKGADVNVSGEIIYLPSVHAFLKELKKLNKSLKGKAELHYTEPNLALELEVNKLGKIKMTVNITPDYMYQQHSFVFEIDQSYLPKLISQCEAIIEQNVG